MTRFDERFGQWAVVTGAAQGVGLAFAEELSERGMHVVMVDRNDAVEDAAASIGDTTLAVVADLADPAWLTSLDAACAGLEIGVVVSNAALSFVGNFVDMEPAKRAAILQVNNDALIELAAWALPPMIDRGRGAFVVMSSGSALAGTAGVGLYAATKAFGLSMAESLSWELRDTGVVTQGVVGPSMSTPMFMAQPFDVDAMAVPPVEPRTVVSRALDALGDDPLWLADEGLEFMAAVPRPQASAIISQATTSMYPSIFGDPEAAG